MLDNTQATRRGPLPGAILPRYRAPAAPIVRCQAPTVLQTGRAPAQLSLFLRPAVAPQTERR